MIQNVPDATSVQSFSNTDCLLFLVNLAQRTETPNPLKPWCSSSRPIKCVFFFSASLGDPECLPTFGHCVFIQACSNTVTTRRTKNVPRGIQERCVRVMTWAQGLELFVCTGTFETVAASLPRATGGSQQPLMRIKAQSITYPGLNLKTCFIWNICQHRHLHKLLTQNLEIYAREVCF